MARPTHGYCPTCREDSALDGNMRCLWCGGATRTSRRRGGTPPGSGRLKDRHVRFLHFVHVEREVSIRELGRRTWKQVGFASPGAAAKAIQEGFRRLGLESRPASAAAELARESGYRNCIEHGCKGYAMHGSERCWGHAEERREEAVARAHTMLAARGVEVSA